MSQEIIDALKELDPKNGDHWTGDGLPKLSALKDVKANRQEVTAAAPHFTRENPTLGIPTEFTGLAGSDKQPAQFTLPDDTTLGLDYVVAKAQEESGLHPAAWNSIDDEEREEYIAATVANLGDGNVQQEKRQGRQEEVADEIVARKNELEEKLAEANTTIAEANKKRDIIQGELDIVISELENKYNDKTTQKDIMAFIKSQNEQRAARVDRYRQMSPLDAALVNSKRPVR